MIQYFKKKMFGKKNKIKW